MVQPLAEGKNCIAIGRSTNFARVSVGSPKLGQCPNQLVAGEVPPEPQEPERTVFAVANSVLCRHGEIGR